MSKTNFIVSSGTIKSIVANINSLTFPKYNMAVNHSTILLILVTSDFRKITNIHFGTSLHSIWEVGPKMEMCQWSQTQRPDIYQSGR